MKNMEVILTSDVYGQINEYAQALTKYPISTNRAHDKIKHMINTLNDIGTSISSLSPCPYEDLGQKFTNEGQPIYTNLRRFNYKDKSGFQWAFACLCNEKSNRITIVKMMPASRVIKEEFSQYRESLLGLWDRMERLPKRQFIH